MEAMRNTAVAVEAEGKTLLLVRLVKVVLASTAQAVGVVAQIVI